MAEEEEPGQKSWQLLQLCEPFGLLWYWSADLGVVPWHFVAACAALDSANNDAGAAATAPNVARLRRTVRRLMPAFVLSFVITMLLSSLIVTG